MRRATDVSAFIAGSVVAEGCFTGTTEPRPTFVLSIGLGAVDADTCHEIQAHLGVGRIVFSPRRKPHYDDEVQYVVKRLTDLVHVIVPFMDEHLPPSYKREQYLEWRVRLLDYWEHRARRMRRDGR